jgi:hypothetical protein
MGVDGLRSTLWPVAAAVGLSGFLALGCPPEVPPEVPVAGPGGSGPIASTSRHPELVEASERIVPYDVASGTTVYAIRDLMRAAERVATPAELAAAASLDLLLYADLSADERTLSGLYGAWGAEDRAGLLAAIGAAVDRIAPLFVPAAVVGVRLQASNLVDADHGRSLRVEETNRLAASGGAMAFNARILLLEQHAELLAAARRSGAVAWREGAARWSVGLSPSSSLAQAGLDPDCLPAATLAAFVLSNAAAIREAREEEPLAAVLSEWLDRVLPAESVLELPLPIAAASLWSDAERPGAGPMDGRPVSGRAFVAATASGVRVGVSDRLRVAADGVERVPGGLSGADEGGVIRCPVTENLPRPPRRWSCLQGALAAARSAVPDGGPLLVAGTDATPAALWGAVAREAAASGWAQMEAAVNGPGGLTGVPFAASDEREPPAGDAVIRVAPGGFYVGRRGELVQVPRVSGGYDPLGLARILEGRLPPFAVVPHETTHFAILSSALAAVWKVSGPAGAVPRVLLLQ